MEKSVEVEKNTYDYFGIFVSALCGVHCIVTPLAMIYMPQLGGFLEEAWVHTLMIVFVVLALYQSVYKHYKLHKSKLALGMGLSGFSILFTTYLIEVFSHGEHHHHESGAHGHDESLLVAVTIIGAILLISSHILNIRACRCLKGEGMC